MTIAAIRNAVAVHYRVNPQELIGRSRIAKTVRARHVAMYLCREILGESLGKIGREFKRDHSSVVHATQRIESLIIVNDEVYLSVKYLSERLKLVAGNSASARRATSERVQLHTTKSAPESFSKERVK